jgi:hypothetical protein
MAPYMIPNAEPQFQAHEFVAYLSLHGLPFRQAVKTLVGVSRFAASLAQGSWDL